TPLAISAAVLNSTSSSRPSRQSFKTRFVSDSADAVRAIVGTTRYNAAAVVSAHRHPVEHSKAIEFRPPGENGEPPKIRYKKALGRHLAACSPLGLPICGPTVTTS